jgi:hypothetical protein
MLLRIVVNGKLYGATIDWVSGIPMNSTDP